MAKMRYAPPMFQALKHRIERSKAELDHLRPLSTAALAQLQKHYDVELTYTSNAIEGNTLTLRETAEVIEHGITVGGKSLRDHLEAVDHYHALQWMRQIASDGGAARRRHSTRIAPPDRRTQPIGDRRPV